MSLNIKQIIGAGLLTLAVVGGTGSYLTSTLHVSAPAVAVNDVVAQQAEPTAQQQIETVIVEGRAS